jgi:hypothetical protein
MRGSQPRARFGVDYHSEARRIIGELVTTGTLKRHPCSEELQRSGEGGGQLRKEPSGEGFLRGTWSELSRYLRTIIVALGATAASLLSLAFIKWLMQLLGLTRGWDVALISSVHSAEITVVCFFLGTSFLREVWAIRKR